MNAKRTMILGATILATLGAAYALRGRESAPDKPAAAPRRPRPCGRRDAWQPILAPTWCWPPMSEARSWASSPRRDSPSGKGSCSSRWTPELTKPPGGKPWPR